jgi:pimeloyl-ACP methyl ester carboxylesterase
MRIDGTVVVEDLSFAYREWGSGPLVLLLHGFPDSPGTYEALGERIAAAGFRAVAPWMRGYGPTGGGAPTGLGRLGRDVLGLAKALEPAAPAHVVGHDWGAAAACIAATLEPDAFRSAVTLGLPHPAHFLARAFGDPVQLRRSWYMWFFQLPELPESAFEGDDYAMMDRLWREWSPGLEKAPHRAELVETFQVGGLSGPLGYYRAIFAETAGSDPADDALYGPVGVPTLALMGEDDGCITADYLEGQEQYWHAPVSSEAVPGCGHFLHIEQPDEIGQRLLSFIAQH